MPKPYVSGLRIGKKLDDLDAIQWATLGILGLAWTDDEAAVWQDAFDVAAATLNRLRSESRKSEADDYQQKVDQTLIRDVFVRISWSGEADIDLMVEEPSGTVCSARNRTPPAAGCSWVTAFITWKRTRSPPSPRRSRTVARTGSTARIALSFGALGEARHGQGLGRRLHALSQRQAVPRFISRFPRGRRGDGPVSI